MDHSKVDAKLADLAAFIKEAEDAAYARGFQDALAKVTAAAHHMEATPGDFRHKPRTIEIKVLRSIKAENTMQEPREGSDQAQVLNDIRMHPGSRGFEIVKRLEGQVHERTVRTSIHRLKNRRAISQIDDKWFPAELPEKDEDRLFKE